MHSGGFTRTVKSVVEKRKRRLEHLTNVLLSLIASVTAVLGYGPKKEPAWVDSLLAGYSIDKHVEFVGFDSSTGYYLMRTGECDWGITDLILTKDRNIIVDSGYNVPGFTSHNGMSGGKPIKKVRLRSLATGKGIKIGDDEAAVAKILGKPTSRHKSGGRGQYINLQYVWKHGPKDEEAIVDQTYIFKQGKLIEIDFDQTMGLG